MDVFVKVLPNAFLPQYKSEEAAGADLFACLAEPITLRPMERRLIPTGICVEFGAGCEMQVRPRSGLALKHGITVLNTPGTVDSDYRGELKVLLINLGSDDFVINHGDRIAQIIISEVKRVNFVQSSSLSETKRGSSGYGSTGV